MANLLTVVMMILVSVPNAVLGHSADRLFRQERRYGTGGGKAEVSIDKRGRQHSEIGEGQQAPNFTLKDVEGRSVSLESLRGKVVLLNFWATWCPYCVEEMPALEQLQREFKNKGVVILSINLEDQKTARAFMRRNAYTFTALVDSDNEVAALYEVEALPTVFVIGRDGEMVRRFVGATGNSKMRAAIALAGIKTKSRDA